jgi:tetratricopeptide (TPR) repeat protein
MQFDPDNNVVKLCAEGMRLEGAGRNEEALEHYTQAWSAANNDFEKFTAAHYIARHQKDVVNKLNWDEIALRLALGMDDKSMEASYPSLYLNVAKCYEDMGDVASARKNYELALSFTDRLPDDGYGRMIRGGIQNGIERVMRQCE